MSVTWLHLEWETVLLPGNKRRMISRLAIPKASELQFLISPPGHHGMFSEYGQFPGSTQHYYQRTGQWPLMKDTSHWTFYTNSHNVSRVSS